MLFDRGWLRNAAHRAALRRRQVALSARMQRPSLRSGSPALLAAPGFAHNSPSDPLRGRQLPRGSCLSSVLKQGALGASPGAMRDPLQLRCSAPQTCRQYHPPAPLAPLVDRARNWDLRLHLGRSAGHRVCCDWPGHHMAEGAANAAAAKCDFYQR